MNKLEALDNLGELVEKELVTNLKLIREGSYGILSRAVKEREINRFKMQRLKREGTPLLLKLSDEEIDIIIEYILLKSGIRVNEKDVTKHIYPDLDER